MRRFSLTILVLVLGHALSLAKDAPELATSLIPTRLTSNAIAVVRNHDLNIKIVSQTEALVKETYAITILNDKGAAMSRISESHDKFRTIKSIKATLFDKDGKKIREARTSDFTDRNSYEYSFYSDDRVKEYNFSYSVYPYTIVVETERRLASLFFLPDWQIQPRHDISVERGSFKIEYPEDMSIRYRLFHVAEQMVEENNNGAKELSCLVANIHAFPKDVLALVVGYNLPQILIAADDVVLEEYSAKFNNWESFGRFYHELNKGRDVLPDVAKQAVHRITDTCSTERSKIGALYSYLKNTTRYVSIQLGIGGWQTLPAKFVAEKGYGDCKALTNYMKALLQEAGIVSYPVLVSATEEHTVMLADFVHNSFNHVILAVPIAHDTVWIECTAKGLPEGYLSNFTHDRNVLLVTPEGGKMIKTPTYTHSDNKLVRKVSYNVDTNNTLDAQVSIYCAGSFFEAEEGMFRENLKSRVEKQLSGKFALPNHSITNYNFYHQHSGNIPVIVEDIRVRGVAKLSRSGSRLFLVPFILSSESATTTALPKERADPFFVSQSREIVDTVSVNIPDGYIPEYLPAGRNVEHDFGAYSCSYSFQDGRLTVTRSYRESKGLYPASSYSDFLVLMRNAIAGGEYEKIALVKKQ